MLESLGWPELVVGGLIFFAFTAAIAWVMWVTVSLVRLNKRLEGK